VNVPEVALIDIYEHIEQKLQLLFNMANATQTGVNREAGLYAFSP
jgi:hypothetical protein